MNSKHWRIDVFQPGTLGVVMFSYFTETKTTKENAFRCCARTLGLDRFDGKATSL